MSHLTTRATHTATWLDRPKGETAHSDRGCRERAATFVPLRATRAWTDLERLRERGYTRAIGVSNYGSESLSRLVAHASIRPAVNQAQFSPFRFRRRLLEACEHNDVVLEAYSPLERGRRLEHPAIVEIAQRLQRTPAQVMLRWALQHNAVVIPKSSQAERIRSNAQIFDFVLSAHDMSTLEALDQTNGSGYKLIGGQALLAVAREVSSVALSRFQQKATAARGVEFGVHARVRVSHRLVRRNLKSGWDSACYDQMAAVGVCGGPTRGPARCCSCGRARRDFACHCRRARSRTVGRWSGCALCGWTWG